MAVAYLDLTYEVFLSNELAMHYKGSAELTRYQGR